MTARLFEPFSIRGVTLRNRIVVSPMCQYSCVDGFANEWHMVHLGSRAVGGAAAVIAEATAVTADGRISPDDLGIWTDAQAEPLARIFAFIESQGAVPGLQLAHAGRKASTAAPFKGGGPLPVSKGGWSPIFGPSAVAFTEGWQTPVSLDRAGIHVIVAAFAAAARRVLDAGGRVLELHAAHGYLLQEFLSPVSNHRNDEFGGTFDNRIRFLCDVTDAVRRVWPDRLPLFVRISSTDWVDGGWTIEDSVALARRLKGLAVDVIDCSSAGNVPNPKIPLGPGYQVAFAERIRREAAIATAAVGLITDPRQAARILEEGQADLVVMARELLRDPYWPIHAAIRLGHAPEVPPQYKRAY